MKKKITSDIKAVVMLIIAENLLALKNIIGTIVKSASRSVRAKEGTIIPGGKKKA